MTTATQPREPEMGLTFEKVWAMFQETDRQIRELSEENKETDRQMRETDRKIREMNEETNRKIRETNKHIGDLGHRFGELAEHLVAPNIAEKFNALGFQFSHISTELREIFRDKSNQATAEIDILLENKESIVGVEVKSKPSDDDVKDHVLRLEKLRHYKDEIGDKRKIHGALAGAIMTDTVRNAALKAGLYVITQTGDTVKIDVPKGFVPKVW
jgi:hypothetical protein